MDKKRKSRNKKSTVARGNLRIIPLGGLGEVGKNMMVMETSDEMILIDAGLMFPLEEMPGVDLVLPDYTYVVENRKKLKGIVLTHGHEDHVGALPYLLREVNAPVYGSRLTLGLVKEKLEELNVKAHLRLINERSKIKLGAFKIEFIPQIHSIPDGMALVIRTPWGIIFHSGDFKFDHTPVSGQRVYYERFSEIAKEGVLILFSDSTNSEIAGFTPSERVVAARLREIFARAEGKLIIASFASHIHRIQQIIDAARSVNRYVAISGRSMRQSIKVSLETGHLNIPDDTFIDIYEVKNLPRNKVCILCTGSQGEPLSALSLIASREHKHIKVEKGDTVIISAHPIPGNERSVSLIIDRLLRNGARVVYERDDNVHVSGHASQEELKLMINLIRPEYFVPIHGEYHHLKKHAELAEEAGIPKSNILVLENGDILITDGVTVKKEGRVNAGVIYVDGIGIGDIKDVVLRDRRHLAQDGILIVVMVINQLTGEIVQGPDIISRGVTYKEKELHAEGRMRIIKKIEKLTQEEEITDWNVIKNDIKNVLSSFIYEKTRRRPMILPIVLEV